MQDAIFASRDFYTILQFTYHSLACEVYGSTLSVNNYVTTVSLAMIMTGKMSEKS